MKHPFLREKVILIYTHQQIAWWLLQLHLCLFWMKLHFTLKNI